MKSRYVLPTLTVVLLLLSFSQKEPMTTSLIYDNEPRWDSVAQAYLTTLGSITTDTVRWADSLDKRAIGTFFNGTELLPSRYRQAIAYYKRSLSLRAQIAQRDPSNKNNLEQIIRSYTNMANFAMQLNFLREGEAFIKAAMDSIDSFRTQGLFYDSFRHGRAYHVQGRIAEEREGLKKAKEIYQKALACYRDTQHTKRKGSLLAEDVAALYNDMATMFTQWGEWHLANTYADSAITLVADLYGKYRDPFVITYYMPLHLRSKADAAHKAGKPELSNMLYENARFILYSDADKTPTGTALLHDRLSQAIATCKVMIENADTSLSIPKLTIPSGTSPDLLAELVGLNIDQSSSMTALGRGAEAKSLLNEALQMLDTLIASENLYLYRIYQAKALHNLGELRLNEGKHNDNIALQDSALSILSRGNHSPAQSISDVDRLEILRVKAVSQLASDRMSAAIKTYDSALAIINTLQERYIDTSVRMQLRKASQAIFSGAIEANYASGDLEKAFQLTEKNKAYALLKTIRQQESLKGVDSDLLQEAMLIKQALSGLENEAITQLNPTPSKNEIARLEKRLSIVQSQLQSNPAYRKAFSEDVLPSQDVNRKIVGSEQALVEYHVGDSSTIIFHLINGQMHAHLVDLNRESIAMLEQEVYEGIYSRHDTTLKMGAMAKEGAGSTPSLKERYTLAAKTLYDSLFKPIVPHLKEHGIEDVILIPDGALSRLPFGALLTETPSTSAKDAAQFDNYAFLIKDYTFTVGYSATLLDELQQNSRTTSSPSRTAMLPSYGETKKYTKIDSEASLHSPKLPEKVINSFDGHIYSGPEASKDSFFTSLEKGHSYLYFLYLHGIYNEYNSDKSYILFAQGDTLDLNQALYQQEIYNLPILVEIMMLFSCNTNRGEIVPGEGMMSLARALNYAGVKSIIAPFWAISDEGYTYEIIEKLLTNLKPGSNSPATILRKAQLEVIERDRDPYHWAAFSYIGPPSNRADSSRWPWGILALAVVVLAWIALRKKSFAGLS